MWLCQDVVALKQKWDFYLGLFGKRENFVLFEVAPLAFQHIEESVRIDIVMLVCRLGDGLKSCGEDNLTFARLEDSYKTDATLKGLVRKYREEDTALFRTHRHKLIAHNDLNSRLNPAQYPIQSLSKTHMDTAIASAAKILNHIAWNYIGTEYGFGQFSSISSDALIYWLQKARDYREDRAAARAAQL
jgi:hypothetical protein